jgi:sec-independent protein translocase protein TatA
MSESVKDRKIIGESIKTAVSMKMLYLCQAYLKNTEMNLTYVIAGQFGATEIILVLLVVVLLFGGKKIPELMRGLGKGMKEFKDASKGEDETGSHVTPPEKKA